MDPNRTLDILLDSLVDGDRDTAIDALEALTGWLEKDGFMPDLNKTFVVSGRDEQIANLREQLAKQSSMATGE